MPPRRKRAAAPARRSARFAEQDAANEKAEEHANRTYEIGDRVEARWRGGEAWFPGTIHKCHPDGMYHITFWDGSEDDSVSPHHVRRAP